jgi:hypothetical protein
MKKIIQFIAVVCLSCCALGAIAQSLEATYAQLCTDGKQSETCDVLRKAVNEKLPQPEPVAAPATLPAIPAPTPEMIQTWGPLAHLVRTIWVWEQADGTGMIHRFDWYDEAHTSIQFRNIYNDKVSFDILFKPGPKPGTVIGTQVIPGKKKTQDVTYRFESEEVLVSDWHRGWSGWGSFEDRKEISFISGVYNLQEITAKKGERPDFHGYSNLYKRYSHADAAKVAARTNAAFQAVLDEGTRQYEQEQAERKQRRAETFNQVLGAATTVVTATSEALAQTQAPYPQGSAIAPIAATSAIAGATSNSPASYPKQPLIDMGAACSMMTQDNYRAAAVKQANDDDAHLRAACGQAFELYHMYENAIRQGYSEADSMRTWNAHKGAAENAMNYYETRRAK